MQYLREREGLETLQSEFGFATYKIRPDKSCYIQDIYVRKDKRRTKEATRLAEQITMFAKESGCTRLVGSVDYRANGAKASERVLHSYGMRPYKTENSLVYFHKEI